MRPDLSNLISKQDALKLLFSRWTPRTGVETVPLSEAAGRILAQDQFANYNLPIVRASTMDGIAVHSQAFAQGMPDTSGWKLGVDYIRADTGDDFDDTFDAVIAIENVELLPEGGVRFRNKVNGSKGMNVKPCGADVKKGSLLAAKGTNLTAQALAAIGMGGISEIPVVKRPRVAFIPTGSELVPVGEPLKRGQNFDTNSVLAHQMLLDMGAEPVMHPIVKDDLKALKEALEQVLPESDIILINAGTSKGGEDYSYKLLEDTGNMLFHGVAAVPGRPMSMALLDGKPLVNLSGPAFAAFYSMDWAVRALVCHALGITAPVREVVSATLAEPLQTPPFFSLMATLRLEQQEDGSYLAHPLALRGPKAAGSAGALMADAVYLTTPGEPSRQAGTVIQVELLKNRGELERPTPQGAAE